MACSVCMGINSDRCPVCGHEPSFVECPDCTGKGYVVWWAVDIRTGNEVEVNETTWNCLPATPEMAERLNQHYYQGDREECETCEGSGEVEYDPDFDDYFDEDEYMERHRND